MDDYGLRHLAEHLDIAERYDQLHSLVEAQDWYAAKSEFDLSQQLYAEDVSRSLAACNRQVEQSIQSRDLEAAEAVLPTLLAHSLLYSTIRSKAARVAPETLEALVKLGQGERAIRQIDLLMNPLAQAEAYHRIGRALYDRGQIGDAHKLMKRAASITTRTEIDLWNELLSLQAKIVIALHDLGDEETSRALLAQLQKNVDQLLEGNISGAVGASVFLAKALVNLGMIDNALTLAQDEAEDKTTSVKILCTIALHVKDIGNLDDARRYLNEATLAVNDVQDVTTIEIVASSLARCGEFDRAQQLIDKLSPRGRVNILAVMSRVAAEQGDSRQSVLLFQKCVEYAQSNNLASQQLETWVQTPRTLMHTGEGHKAQDLLLSLYDAARVDATAWSNAALSVLASALIDVELASQAAKLIDAVFAMIERPMDDWEQTKALSTMADVFAPIGYVDGLNGIRAYTHGFRDSWQQAWSLTALAKAWAQVDKQSKAQNTIVSALEAAQNEQDEWRRLLALIDVAEGLQDQFDMQQAHTLLQQADTASEHLESEWERSWVLAAEARVLLRNGNLQRSKEKFNLAFETLTLEADPNYRPVAISSICRMVTSFKMLDLLTPLVSIARETDEEFGAAAGLFSIAYAMAEQDRLDEAWTLFREAVDLGRWRTLSVNAESQMVISPGLTVDRAWTLAEIQTIGWLPTRAAFSCALVSLLTRDEPPRRLSDLLDLMHNIPTGHSEEKTLALRAIERLVTQTSLNQFDWLECILQIFEFVARQEDRSAVWGTIGVVFPTLAKHFYGTAAIQETWQKLLAVDRLYVSRPGIK